MRCGGRPDVMFVSIVCLSFEGVRIGEARHVYFWGNPNGINSDRNVCHMSPGEGPYTNHNDLLSHENWASYCNLITDPFAHFNVFLTVSSSMRSHHIKSFMEI